MASSETDETSTETTTASLGSLEPAVLERVLARLEWEDLYHAGQASSALRGASHHAWEGLFRARWSGTPNAALYPEQRSRWQRLFLSGNGWLRESFEYESSYVGGSPAAVAVASDAAGRLDYIATVGQAEGTMIIWVGREDSIFLSLLWAGRAPTDAGRPELATALALVSVEAGLVATGGLRGSVRLCQLTREEGGATPPATVAASYTPDTSRGGVTQLIRLQDQLIALHDVTTRRGPPGGRRSAVTALDLASLTPLATPAADILEGYQLSGMAVAEQHGPVVVAGSVRLSDYQILSGRCPRCAESDVHLPPSLCFHKPASSAAALCVFDLRARLGLASRYALPHRSLHPRMELVREHFLCTSHAGAPLAVWDLRKMGGGPVFDQPRLGPRFRAAHPPTRRLPAPGCDPHSQALCLASNGDMLVGATDNGMAWLWDLSDCLGWADGSHAGTWVAAAEAGGHFDESDLARWPRPIGSLAPRSRGDETDWQGFPPIALNMTGRRLVASFAAPVEELERFEDFAMMEVPTTVVATLHTPRF